MKVALLTQIFYYENNIDSKRFLTMSKLQSEIEKVDSKIKILVDKKNKLLEKKRSTILTQIEKTNLFNWEQPTLTRALKFLEEQAKQNTKLYQDWENGHAANQKDRPTAQSA